MRSGLRVAVAAVLFAVLLAGCAQPAAEGPAPAPSPVIVTRPSDFSALENGSRDDRPHLHDYWGGKDRLLIMEGPATDQGPGLFGGGPVVAHVFRPEAGSVVPLGTRFVDVTFTWEAAPGDSFKQPELWLKTAADKEAVRVGPVESGATVRVVSANEKNDLPHQVVSAWEFDFAIYAESDVAPGRFKGPLSIRVEAVRGLEIPLFPAHPDRWNGASEILLVDEGQESVYVVDPDGGVDCLQGCPYNIRPKENLVVPFDAARVVAVLEHGSDSPTRLGLSFHGANVREFTRLAPTKEEGRRLVYDIALERGMADGPYSVQSLWEFYPVIEAPQRDGAFAGSYWLTVTVFKLAA